MSKEDAAKQAEAAFRLVFEHGPKIELDHHVVYHARKSSTFVLKRSLNTVITDYELGRLLACAGRTDEARKEFELVLSGKHLEVGASGKKGKYSLEVSVGSPSLRRFLMSFPTRTHSTSEHTQQMTHYTQGVSSISAHLRVSPSRS